MVHFLSCSLAHGASQFLCNLPKILMQGFRKNTWQAVKNVYGFQKVQRIWFHKREGRCNNNLRLQNTSDWLKQFFLSKEFTLCQGVPSSLLPNKQGPGKKYVSYFLLYLSLPEPWTAAKQTIFLRNCIPLLSGASPRPASLVSTTPQSREIASRTESSELHKPRRRALFYNQWFLTELSKTFQMAIQSHPWRISPCGDDTHQV